jgi:hypothetical protein
MTGRNHLLIRGVMLEQKPRHRGPEECEFFATVLLLRNISTPVNPAIANE